MGRMLLLHLLPADTDMDLDFDMTLTPAALVSLTHPPTRPLLLACQSHRQVLFQCPLIACGEWFQ